MDSHSKREMLEISNMKEKPVTKLSIIQGSQ